MLSSEVPISGRLYTPLPSSHTSQAVKADSHTIRKSSRSLRPEFLQESPCWSNNSSHTASPCFQFSLLLFWYVIPEATKAFSLRVTEIRCSQAEFTHSQPFANKCDFNNWQRGSFSLFITQHIGSSCYAPGIF